MKHILIICLLLLIAGTVSAIDGAFFTIGGEVNGNTREGFAAGGIFSIGFDINRYFAMGIKKTYSYDFEEMTVMEDAVFFRYYPLETFRLFIQAELGTVIFFDEGKSSPSIMGGLAVGWHIPLGNNFYVEPIVRAGYPFLWSTGVMVGFRFNEKLADNNKQGTVNSEQLAVNSEQVTGE